MTTKNPEAHGRHRGHEHVVIRFQQGVDEIERQLAAEGLLP
jgi:hypothetical protein